MPMPRAHTPHTHCAWIQAFTHYVAEHMSWEILILLTAYLLDSSIWSLCIQIREESSKTKDIRDFSFKLMVSNLGFKNDYNYF